MYTKLHYFNSSHAESFSYGYSLSHYCHRFIISMKKGVDLDQLIKPADLDLHCFQKRILCPY